MIQCPRHPIPVEFNDTPNPNVCNRTAKERTYRREIFPAVRNGMVTRNLVTLDFCARSCHVTSVGGGSLWPCCVIPGISCYARVATTFHVTLPKKTKSKRRASVVTGDRLWKFACPIISRQDHRPRWLSFRFFFVHAAREGVMAYFATGSCWTYAGGAFTGWSAWE